MELAAFKLPKLEFLDISFNRIEKVNEGWTGHESLIILKSVDNRFKNLNAFKNMPKLEELYLGQNAISQFNGWEGLPVLKKLHLRKNKIEKFDEEIPDLPELKYLNLRDNKIAALDQAARMFQFVTLEDLNLVGCPLIRQFSSFNMLLAEILIKNPKLVRFSKVTVEDSHKLEAVYLAEYRWRIEEEERIRKEREEREREEAEAEAAAN